MKRNIIINATRSALVISNDLSGAVKQVASDSGIGEEIYAFDTYLHVCYSFKATIEGFVEGFEVIENSIPLKDFRSFAKYYDNDYSKVYKALIRSVISE